MKISYYNQRDIFLKLENSNSLSLFFSQKMIPREKHSRSLDSERDRNNVFTEITAWLTTIVLYLGSFYKKERQAARPFIFPTEGLAITFYLSPLPQIDYTRARRREGMTITERGQRTRTEEFSPVFQYVTGTVLLNAASYSLKFLQNNRVYRNGKQPIFSIFPPRQKNLKFFCG